MKISLTPLELKVIEEYLANEKKGILIEYDTSTETGQAFMSVVNKADNLMGELKAFDETDESLIEWFYQKYQKSLQQKKEGNI